MLENKVLYFSGLELNFEILVWPIYEDVFKAVIHKTKARWVELPDCAGKDGEIWLKTTVALTFSEPI